MRAFIVDRYGKSGQGRIGEMPEPQLRENDVLVEVHAAGVNLLDSKIRSGEFKLILTYRLPLILGNDVEQCLQRRFGRLCAVVSIAKARGGSVRLPPENSMR